VIFDGVEIAVGGGGESISLVQNEHANTFHAQDPALLKIKGEVYMPMIDTAKWWPSATAFRASARTSIRWKASAAPPRPAGGKFNDELAPITTKMGVTDKATGAVSFRTSLSRRTKAAPRYFGRRPCQPQPVRGEGFTVTAGNASQLSDGASASVIMSDKEASSAA